MKKVNSYLKEINGKRVELTLYRELTPEERKEEDAEYYRELKIRYEKKLRIVVEEDNEYDNVYELWE